jgi:carboxyl-terminal processing protease
MLRRALLALMMGGWALGLAGAATAAGDSPGTPYVVVIGIDKYADPQIKPRKFAEADAKALYDLFTSKDYLGVEPKNIKLLLGEADAKRNSEPATRANIIKSLEWLEKTPTKDDLVIFAIIGEGAPLGERSVYFASDSTFKDRAKDAVAGGDIENHLDKMQSQRFVAFVDVNFMGFDLGKEKAPDPNLGNFYREFLGNEEAKGHNPSRVVFLPNSGLKPALETDKGGLFTAVLLDGMKGKADIEGYEPDGNITVAELVKYVRKEMPERARLLGKDNEEKGQTPVVFDFHNTDFFVDYNPAAHPLAETRVKKFDEIAKDKALPKDIAEEGHNLLVRMPKLDAQQSLRKVYQKLADGKIDVAGFEGERKVILASIILPDSDASNFAIMVMRAARMVRQGYVKDVNQGNMIDNAVKGLYKSLNEKIPSSIGDKLADTKALKEADLIKILTEARQQLGKREDLARGKDITAALNAMLEKLDRHTGYIDPETARKFENDTRGDFSGIGVQIRKNNVRDQLQVVTPIMNSPAYKAKIYANDVITQIIREVDSEGAPLAKPEVIPTKGMTTEEAVVKILGKPGTKVKLTVDREGEKAPLEFNLVRGTVEVETVMGHKRNADDSWNYVIDPENKICYVRLTQFSGNTTRSLENLMKKLSSAGIKGFVLDLRFNPGGLLDGAVKISDLFIDDGMIVTIRPRNGAETSYIGKSDGSYTSFPMVCLVNGGSASASEIVSACLQDHGRAIVVGSRSFGKGSVQTIHQFDTGGRLKLTTATFWRPSNKNLNRASTGGKEEDEWGVKPDAGFDIKITAKELNDLQDFQRDQEIIHRPGHTPPPDSGKAEFKDRQLESALEYLRGQIKAGTKVTLKR